MTDEELRSSLQSILTILEQIRDQLAPVPNRLQTSIRTKSRLLTTDEAAAYLRVEKATLTTWRCTRQVDLPFVKIGGAVRYSIDDLDKWIAENAVDRRRE